LRVALAEAEKLKSVWEEDQSGISLSFAFDRVFRGVKVGVCFVVWFLDGMVEIEVSFG
jgi:hypothetical protein